MSDNDADAAFVALAADLLEEIAAGRALELAAGQPGMVDAHGRFHAAPPPPVQPPPVPEIPEPKKGAAAVHPHLGDHLVTLPGDTISGLAHAHIRPSPGPVPYVPPDGSDSDAEAPGEQQGTDVLPDRELDRRGVYTAARGTTQEGVDVPLQPPEHPAGLPQRPGR
jgi:hypothetical protein